MPSHLTEDELARLIGSRLLRLEEHYGAQRIELTHDVLTGVVREHRDRRRAEEEKRTLAETTAELTASGGRNAPQAAVSRAGTGRRLALVLGVVAVVNWRLAVKAAMRPRPSVLRPQAVVRGLPADAGRLPPRRRRRRFLQECSPTAVTPTHQGGICAAHGAESRA